MKKLTVLSFVLFISVYASAEQMPDSTVYATTYIVRGDSVFVKSDPEIVLGELKFKGQVYIYRKNVEIASFNSSVTITRLQEMDSILIVAVPAERGAFIKSAKDTSIFLGGSIMYVVKYPPVTTLVDQTIPMKRSIIRNTDYRKFNIQGRIVRQQHSGITITNRKVFMTFGIRKR
jgi:hypothetical protein